MEKIDFKKSLKHLYQPSPKQSVMVEVPPMNYLMINGKGDPNTSQEYKEAIEALFPLAYSLKFTVKKNGQLDYTVPPVESLWWADDVTAFTSGRRDEWLWTAMIMQPSIVTSEMVDEAKASVAAKRNPAGLSKVSFGTIEEGWCAQIMYIGSFADEGPTIEALHDFITSEGHDIRGKHHEIYLNDFRRTAPEKLKTVIRQPAA